MKKQIDLLEKDVQNILKKYLSEELISFSRLSGGYANPALLINEKYVLRLNTRTPGSHDEPGSENRFEREAVLYQLFQSKNIPAPHFYTLDNDREIIPYQYIILSYLPGKILADSYKDLSENARRTVSAQVGSILKKVHSIGKIDLEENLSIFTVRRDWKDAIIEEFTKYFDEIKDKEYLSKEQINQTQSVYDSYLKIPSTSIPSKLIHYDFHANHIIENNGHVSGFFDFEWAQLGDPLWDFQKLPLDFAIDTVFDKESFFEGYGASSMTEEEKTRYKTYCLLQGLWTIWAMKSGNYSFPAENIHKGYYLIDKTLED